MISSGDRIRTYRLFQKLIDLYGKCYFESKLKCVLLNNDLSRTLLNEISRGMDVSIKSGRIYQSSQLLPVYVKWGGKSYDSYITCYFEKHKSIPSPLVNIAESLQYFPKDKSSSFLIQKLLDFGDELIIEELTIANLI